MRGTKVKELRRAIYGAGNDYREKFSTSEGGLQTRQERLARVRRNIFQRAKKFAVGASFRAVKIAAARAVDFVCEPIINEVWPHGGNDKTYIDGYLQGRRNGRI